MSELLKNNIIFTILFILAFLLIGAISNFLLTIILGAIAYVKLSELKDKYLHKDDI